MSRQLGTDAWWRFGARPVNLPALDRPTLPPLDLGRDNAFVWDVLVAGSIYLSTVGHLAGTDSENITDSLSDCSVSQLSTEY